MKSCCFTGHRPADMPFLATNENRDFRTFMEHLEAAVLREIDRGARRFITGMCVGMDLWAACVVLRLREERPELGIVLVGAIPHEGQERSWPQEAQEAYRRIRSACDETVCFSQRYYRGVMHVRNRYMVDNADVVIAALRPGAHSGGTWSTVQYARKKGKEVVNIFENLPESALTSLHSGQE